MHCMRSIYVISKAVIYSCRWWVLYAEACLLPKLFNIADSSNGCAGSGCRSGCCQQRCQSLGSNWLTSAPKMHSDQPYQPRDKWRKRIKWGRRKEWAESRTADNFKPLGRLANKQSAQAESTQRLNSWRPLQENPHNVSTR